MTASARLIAHVRTPLFRNGYALLLNYATTAALGMAYWVLAARFYSTATVGLNSAAISAMTLLAGLSQLSMGGALVRFIPGAGRATLRFVLTTFLISTCVALVVDMVFLQGIHIWAHALSMFGSDPWLKCWFIAATITWCLFGLQESALVGMRQATWVPVKSAVFSVAKIVLLIGLARLIPQYGLFASWTIGALITLVPLSVLVFRRLIPKHVEQAGRRSALVPRQVVSYAGANFLAVLFGMGSTTLLPLIVTQQVGTTANAYFFLAWQIASILFLIGGTMGMSLIVESVIEPGMLEAYTYRVFIQIMRIVVPLTSILVLGAPYILHIFGDEYANHAAGLLRLLAISAIPVSITTLYCNVAIVGRHMRAIVAVDAATCVLTLGMSHFMLQIFGITGVGVAYLASECVVAVAVLFTPELRALWPSRRHVRAPELA